MSTIENRDISWTTENGTQISTHPQSGGVGDIGKSLLGKTDLLPFVEHQEFNQATLPFIVAGLAVLVGMSLHYYIIHKH